LKVGKRYADVFCISGREEGDGVDGKEEFVVRIL